MVKALSGDFTTRKSFLFWK